MSDPAKRVVTCETNRHIFGSAGNCIFCGIEKVTTAEPEPAFGDWRPIETAPQDGRHVLVYCQHGQYVVAWHDDDGNQSEYAYWMVDDNKHGPFGLRGAEPTHWMPLPEPPK